VIVLDVQSSENVEWSAEEYNVCQVANDMSLDMQLHAADLEFEIFN
jgi:hypothetical protein